MSDVSFIVRKDSGWKVLVSHIGMGEGPVGPRLAKGTEYPSHIGVKFRTKREATAACEKWTEWYFSQPYVKKKLQNKKGRKKTLLPETVTLSNL